MRIIKKIFVKWAVKKALKTLNIKRLSIGYAKAKLIGIVADAALSDVEALQKFVKSIEKDGKKVELLIFQQETATALQGEKFTWKDFSLNGTLQNTAVQRFIDTEFDYLFSVAKRNMPALNYVLAHSKALCRIGQFVAGNHLLYEMMVKTPNEKILYERLIQYTKTFCYA
jgi:hypothetical protein